MYDAYDAYLESRVESADPIQLVRLLYQGAMASLRDARTHLAAGDIAARSRAISKAHAILTELMSALDYEPGEEIAVRLARLYDYMQRRILEANLKQTDAPLAEVLGLLATLGEAWNGIQTEEPRPAAQNAWAPPVMNDAPAYSAGGWNL